MQLVGYRAIWPDLLGVFLPNAATSFLFPAFCLSVTGVTSAVRELPLIVLALVNTGDAVGKSVSQSVHPALMVVMLTAQTFSSDLLCESFTGMEMWTFPPSFHLGRDIPGPVYC